jgi:hypothetical protein
MPCPSDSSPLDWPVSSPFWVPDSWICSDLGTAPLVVPNCEAGPVCAALKLVAHSETPFYSNAPGMQRETGALGNAEMFPQNSPRMHMTIVRLGR